MFKQVFKEKLKKIPPLPGVYFFFDKNKKPLYIGKAVNLRNRIKQYFTEKTYSPFLSHLLEEAKKIDFEVTDSEIEALILESQYIKKYRPKYNQKLRDDKQYFYVIFTKEKFPKIFLSHQPIKFQIQNSNFKSNSKVLKFKIENWNLSSGVNYIGPFTDGTVLKSTLRFLRKIFPYCTCKQKHNNYCLNYHIGKCLGFCCLKDNAERSRSTAETKTYKKNIKAIKEILTGKREALIKKLKKELAELAEKEKFEKAIELRDKIEKLERVFENAKILQKLKYYDNMYYHSVEKTLLKLRTVLNLPNVPRRIEGYDVSNIQGTNATGSMVVFTNGQLDKKEYRKFKIKSRIVSAEGLPKADDIAMLKEVLTRRFNHPEWQFPDLILIDGGKTQLNGAAKTLKRLNLEIPVISLSKGKQEKVLLNAKVSLRKISQRETISASGRPMELPPEVQNLIKHIDSEAHRFAIEYYRRLHRSQLK